MNIATDLSLDLYLHSLKLHRGHIQFLSYFFEGTSHLLPKHKFTTDLIKFGYIYEDEITKKGNELMSEILEWTGVYEAKSKAKKVKIEYSLAFLEWWDKYQATDNFVYAGVEFNGTRNLRVKKDECSVAYENILKEGKYTHQEMIDALEWEKVARMDQSVIRKKNEFTFASSTQPYLNQRKFESYVPLAKRGLYVPKSTDQNKVVNTTIAF